MTPSTGVYAFIAPVPVAPSILVLPSYHCQVMSRRGVAVAQRGGQLLTHLRLQHRLAGGRTIDGELHPPRLLLVCHLDHHQLCGGLAGVTGDAVGVVGGPYGHHVLVVGPRLHSRGRT